MSAKKKSPDESDSKVFDVAKPGESSPSATARPIIVNRSGSLKNDPMVTNESGTDTNEDDESKATAPETTQTHEKTIEPSKELIEETQKSSDEEDSSKESEDKDTKTEKTESESDKSNADSEVVDELANEVHTKAQDKKKSEEAIKKQAELQKIIDSKKYYAPIKESSTGGARGGRLLIYILLIALIGVATLNFLIDAEMVDIGVNSLTDFL